MQRATRQGISALALGVTLLVPVWVLGTQATSSQTFRGRTDLVQLAVIALDRDRKPVVGLQASDFTVLDEGKPTPIAVFAPVSVPQTSQSSTSATWIRDHVSDIATNDVPNDGRIVVILFDRSIPAGQGTVRAREIANHIVNALGPNDLAAVVRNSGFGDGQVQGLTRDRSLLRAAIESPFIGEPPSLAGQGRPDCVCGICVLERIELVANQLANMPGRLKNLVFIGREITIQAPAAALELGVPCAFPVRYARERAFRAVDRHNVIVHSLDVSGLETLTATADGLPRLTPAAHLRRQSDLAVFPSYTGGRTVLNTNDFAEPINNIFSETDTYYLLGIERDPTLKTTERRKLTVRVNRRGVTVRSRTGYYATEPDPPPDPAPPAMRAMQSLLPSNALGLRLTLTPTFTATGDVETLLVVEAAGQSDSLQMAYSVFDPRTKPLGSGSLDVDLVENGGLESRVVRATSRLLLKEGQYEIRVGAENPRTGDSGSVYGYVTVPRLSGDDVVMSGAVVSDNQTLSTETHLIPMLRRDFTRSEAPEVRFQIRDGRTPRGTTSVTAAIFDDRDRVVTRSTLRVDPTRFSAAGVASERFVIPVAELPAGRYLLRLEADLKDKSIEGGVTVEGNRGRLQVSTIEGDIAITKSAGEIVAESTEGNVVLKGVTASAVEVSTVEGNVTFEGTLVPSGRYLFTSHEGNIFLAIPENSNATIAARTFSGGKLDSSIPLKNQTTVARGRRATYTLGNGSAQVDLETFEGSIVIRRPGETGPK